jgi:hypothetical protein
MGMLLKFFDPTPSLFFGTEDRHGHNIFANDGWCAGARHERIAQKLRRSSECIRCRRGARPGASGRGSLLLMITHFASTSLALSPDQKGRVPEI